MWKSYDLLYRRVVGEFPLELSLDALYDTIYAADRWDNPKFISDTCGAI